MKERVLATIEIETRVSLTSVDGMEAGHEGGPARRADGVDVVVVEDDARVSQGVDVGRGHLCGNSIEKFWLEFWLKKRLNITF